VHPDLHRNFQQQRHSYLLAEARAGHLAAAIARSRRDERRSALTRFLSSRRRAALVPRAEGI